MPLNFWLGMDKRVGIKPTDKLMIGNIDTGLPEYIDISDLATYLGANPGGGTVQLYKNGYKWTKGEGKTSTAAYEIGDQISGVGTLFAGYAILGYVFAAPTSDPNAYIRIISSVKL